MISEKQTCSTQRGVHCTCSCEWCASPSVQKEREKERERRVGGRLRLKQAWNSACQKSLVLLSGQHHAHRSQSHPLPARVPSTIGGPCRINSPIHRSHLPPGACIPGPADTIFEVKKHWVRFRKSPLSLRTASYSGALEGEAIKEQLEK